MPWFIRKLIHSEKGMLILIPKSQKQVCVFLSFYCNPCCRLHHSVSESMGNTNNRPIDDDTWDCEFLRITIQLLTNRMDLYLQQFIMEVRRDLHLLNGNEDLYPTTTSAGLDTTTVVGDIRIPLWPPQMPLQHNLKTSVFPTWFEDGATQYPRGRVNPDSFDSNSEIDRDLPWFWR